MSEIKQWPIYPKQLVTDRKGCPRCGDSRPQDYAKCAQCGIMTEDFARGNLLGLFSNLKHKLPVALFERVSCPNGEAHVRAYCTGENYHNYGGHLYHIIDCQGIEYELDTPCFKKRKRDPVFKKACIQRDLKRVHAVFENPDKLLEKIDIKVGGTPHIVHYYAETCNNAVPTNTLLNLKTNSYPLTELLIPLFADQDPSQIMGVLMIGQLIIDGDDGKLTVKEKSRHSPSVAKAIMDHAEAIWNFIFRMTTRTDIRRTEYLYAKLDELIANFDEHREDFAQEIRDLFANVCISFDVKRCILFLPQITLDETGQKLLAGYDVLAHADCTNVLLHLEKLCKIPKRSEANMFRTELPLGCLEGVEYDPETCDLFFHCNNNSSVGLAALFKWDQISKEPRKRQAVFFDALLSACYSCIIAQVAAQKQGNIDTFSESTRHDLAQKMGNLELHNARFEATISDIGRMAQKINAKWADGAHEYAKDYHKTMVGLYSSLSFLQRTLDSPEMQEKVLLRSFLPHTLFLYDYARQYNTWGVSAFKGKIVRLPPPVRDDPELVADQDMISRIVSNLLHNANKYAYDGSQIYLECFYDVKKTYKEHSDDCYVFRVTNYGSGIPLEKRDKIFGWGEKLSQAAHGGYGLAISLRYAKLHGGKIYVEEGLIGKDEPLSLYHLPTLLRATRLYNTNNPAEVPEPLRPVFEELSQLRNDSRISAVARQYGHESVWDEMRSSRAPDYFNGLKVTPAYIRLHCKVEPTYRVTFTVIIPQKHSVN